MRLLIDSEMLGSFTSTNPESDDIDETVPALLKSREGAFAKAKENIDKAQKCQKETYNRRESCLSTQEFGLRTLPKRVVKWIQHGLDHTQSTGV